MSDIIVDTPPKPPPPPTTRSQRKRDFQAATSDERESARKKEWIERTRTWDPEIVTNWKAVRVLGTGNFGIAALFEWIGVQRAAGVPEKIVVKQSGGSQSTLRSMIAESRFYQELNKTKSKHVLKMYTSVHNRPGTGTSAQFDPSPYAPIRGSTSFGFKGDNTSRIYTEFCEHGDLFDYTDWKYSVPYSLPEEVAWRMMECMVHGIHVLEYGHEDPPTDPNPLPWERPIVHLDFKAENIFIANRDDAHNDPHHIGILKLADFGLSERVPANPRDPSWLDHITRRGTPSWFSPEQIYIEPNRKFDQSTNVWGIGLTIRHVLTGSTMIDPYTFNYTYQPIPLFSSPLPAQLPTHTPIHPPPQPPLVTIETFASELITDPETKQYSTLLKQTVLRCLAYNPDTRPSAAELSRVVKSALQAFEVVDGDASARKRALGFDIEVAGQEPGFVKELRENWDKFEDGSGWGSTGGWTGARQDVDDIGVGAFTRAKEPIKWCKGGPESGWQQKERHPSWETLPGSP